MVTRPTVKSQFFGILSFFSIGYYVLPIVFFSWSDLGGLSAYDVMVAQSIHLFYFIALVLGF
jgi:hypothetical protein